jgi:ubiquinone biosynthesis accessory factor UbiJ
MNEIVSAVLWPAEKIINHIIKTDTYVLNQIKPFAGKSLEIETHTPSFAVVVLFESDRISLSGMNAETLSLTPDAKVSGEAQSLMNMVTKNKSQAMANSQIAITGDAQFIQDLFQVLQSLDIQWADYLTPFMGDVATNEADNLVKDVRSWSQDANKKLKRNVNDYIKEEARLVPQPSDIDKFSDDLDQLRLKIDRVTAKAEQLFKRVEPVND